MFKKISSFSFGVVILCVAAVFVVSLVIFMLLSDNEENEAAPPVVEPNMARESMWKEPPHLEQGSLQIIVNKVTRVWDFGQQEADRQAFLQVHLLLKDLEEKSPSRYVRIAPVKLEDDMGNVYHNYYWETHNIWGEEDYELTAALDILTFPLPEEGASSVNLYFKTRLTSDGANRFEDELLFEFEDLPLP